MIAPLIAEYAFNAKHYLFGATQYPSDALLNFLERTKKKVVWQKRQGRSVKEDGGNATVAK